VSKLLWILARPFLLWPLPVLALLGLLVLGGAAYEVMAFLERQALGSPLALDWGQLIPPDKAMATRQPVVQGMIQHGQLTAQLDPKTGQPLGETAVMHRYDGAKVRIDGYLVPLAFDGTKVVMFLLVPYAGACIHVPPPPSNQIIYVIAKEGLEPDDDQFRPVRVVGTFKAVELSTAFAEVGYQIVAETVAYSG
jgi:uncharacterized protein